MTADKCARCGKPTHPSESDDDGIGLCCAAYVVEWSSGGMCRTDTAGEAVQLVTEQFPGAQPRMLKSGAVEWHLHDDGRVAVIRRAVRS